MIPKMEGKVWVTAAKGCDKMIVKGLHGAFWGIVAVQVGRDEMKSNASLANEG